MSPDRSQTVYAASAADLALRALDVLRGVEGTAFVAEHVECADDPKAALAAIRFLGADAFAPHLLTGLALHPEDAAVVAQSFAVFPPAVRPPQPPPHGPAEPWIAAWRDWATATLLARLTGTESDGPLAPRPSGAPALAQPPRADETAAGADRACRPTATPGADATDPASLPWQPWSVRMGQLSPLALPALDGAVHAAARAAPLALARGATRAVLRRDFPTAARITRWLALLHAEGVRLPLDRASLVDHLRLHGGGPRLALDVAIAGRLIAGEAAP